MICKYCGSSYEENDKFCPICGRATTGELETIPEISVYQPKENPQDAVNEAVKNSKNGIAITSFILSMLNFVGLGILGVNLAAFILGIFGLKSNRKGFAIAGMIMSTIGIFIVMGLVIALIILLAENNMFSGIDC